MYTRLSIANAHYQRAIQNYVLFNGHRKTTAQLAINEMNLEYHEHTNTVHCQRDLILAQNWGVHALAIEKLVAKESIENEIFLENVRKQKKDLLLFNPNGLLCVKYPKSRRAFHTRPCLIIMPQLYQQRSLQSSRCNGSSSHCKSVSKNPRTSHMARCPQNHWA